MKRALAAGIGVCIAVLLLAPYAVRLWPSELSIRLDPALGGQSVSVRSSNFAGTRRFAPDAGAIRVPSISHGTYDVDFQLTSGPHVWTQYLHTDAGFRRRVDFYISPGTSPGYFHLQITANRWFLPRRLIIFDGDVQAAETSEENPKFIW
jgi:hypothetical protein